MLRLPLILFLLLISCNQKISSEGQCHYGDNYSYYVEDQFERIVPTELQAILQTRDFASLERAVAANSIDILISGPSKPRFCNTDRTEEEGHQISDSLLMSFPSDNERVLMYLLNVFSKDGVIVHYEFFTLGRTL